MGEAKRREMNGDTAPKVAKPVGSTMITVGMVGIAIPSGDQLHTDTAFALASLTGNYRAPHTLISAKGCYVHKGRDHCQRIAAEKGCTHMLFIDGDMLFPTVIGQLPNGNPITPIHRLLAWNKDIVGCIYSRRVSPFTNLGTPSDKSITRSEPGTELLQMDMLPTGFMLIKMEVFDRITAHEKRRSPFFRFKPILSPTPNEHGNYDYIDEMGEDVYFCERAREAGCTLWADIWLSHQLGHIGQAVYRVQDDTKAEAEAVGTPLHRPDTGRIAAVAQ